ncbi:MAG TPA: peroxiredoxin family protein [Gemmatimonadaceae bacterium]|nr:peroxiredoxin family protein [Gemmatimonadaceae bacterium]
MRFSLLFAVVLASLMTLDPAIAPAQEAASSESPDVGEVAPDFALPGATRYGPLREPARLSDYQGKTVVLAFFPRARTKGCTVQMETYRDQYATLFNNGKDVIVIAASVDPDTMLASWARDSNFPMLFVSDVDGVAGRSYGAFDAQRKLDRRALFVIGPDGRVVYRAIPFREMTEEAYIELGKAVASSRGPKSREPKSR